jgi:hypothetical protein
VSTPEDSSKKDDGFGALWALVVQEAQRRMLAEQSAAVDAFRRAQPEPEDSPQVARELGLVAPCLKALEAGVACREAIFRLANARDSTDAAISSPGMITGVEAIILDALRIYLSGYIDACRKFCEAALGQLIPEDDETRLRRDGLKVWASAAKKVLSTGRETVAHGDTAYITGIAEDGLWPPMLLLDAAQEESLVKMFREGVNTDRSKFQWRSNQLFRTAALALAYGEAQMGRTSVLIARKLRPES